MDNISWIWLYGDAYVFFVSLLFDGVICNRFELVKERFLFLKQVFDALQLHSVFWPFKRFLFYILHFLVAFFPCFLSSITLFIFLVFILLLLSNLSKCQVILQPLVLVFIINKIQQYSPVLRNSRRLLVTFNDKVVTMISEIRHSRHVDYSFLNMN